MPVIILLIRTGCRHGKTIGRKSVMTIISIENRIKHAKISVMTFAGSIFNSASAKLHICFTFYYKQHISTDKRTELIHIGTDILQQSKPVNIITDTFKMFNNAFYIYTGRYILLMNEIKTVTDSFKPMFNVININNKANFAIAKAKLAFAMATVTHNEGKISLRYGKISLRDGKVSLRYGKIIYRDSKVSHRYGKIIPCDGKVSHREGKVNLREGKVCHNYGNNIIKFA